ncbi:FAD-dependent oxidoreductase [Mesorhizobium sp. LSJC264A00]|uniref:flavin monoamine oxidase family protein n=1 Tax=Mesorhizobium sp. LSJC264A00 TaxID=1287321 RepID=UPI0003CEA809|nr:FAD-dependent oxidoreductase [Mesorhizobium sp. LSJC264A00]ESX28800.1 hypothetical protein X767_00020 [Mesorhizobium sp. LSJC264A00]
MPPSPIDIAPVDIAIVGAGMAGLFLAWRLSQSEKPARIAVFESAGRVGGRASTVSFPGEPNFGIDLGAMMLMPQHRLLKKLMATLDVKLSGMDVVTGANRLHLRGRSLPYAAISRFAPRRLFAYDVTRRLQEKGPSRLLRKAAALILPGSEAFGSAEWNGAAGFVYRGRKLADWATWDVLATVLTPEEMAFAEDAVGYSLLLRRPNAAETFRLALGELSGGRSYCSPDGGFQPVAERMAGRIAVSGGAVHLDHTVTAIARSAQGMVLSVEGQGGTVEARKVVLALPVRPLRTLLEKSGIEQPSDLPAPEPWPMLTLAACYASPWWARNGIAAGHSVTDLPARQIWQFTKADARDATIRRSVAMAYCDGRHMVFWRSLLPELARRHGFAVLAEGHSALEAFHGQMVEVHGKHGAISKPIGGFAQDWGAPAYGGASHVWDRGIDISGIKLASHTLAPGIHVCGEAWSNNHGWIEGALESAEDLLQREFGLDAWLA